MKNRGGRSRALAKRRALLSFNNMPPTPTERAKRVRSPSAITLRSPALLERAAETLSQVEGDLHDPLGRPCVHPFQPFFAFIRIAAKTSLILADSSLLSRATTETDSFGLGLGFAWGALGPITPPAIRSWGSWTSLAALGSSMLPVQLP